MPKAESSIIVANWMAFLALGASTVVLMISAFKYKGPGRNEAYYNGFREHHLLGVFINLFCCLAYYAKILESMTEHGAGFPIFTTVKYMDYVFTCPLIVVDMMWHLNAPYRFTMGGLVLVTLGIGVASHNAVAPASYAWFGMGATIFSGVYYGIIMIVRERLGFYTEMARDSNAKQSIKYLKIACYIFFTVWMIYPILWVLGTKGFGLISDALDHVIMAVFDVIAKSAYGFAMLYFRLYFDKKLLQAGVTKDDFHKFEVEAMQRRPPKSSPYTGGYSAEDKYYYPDEEADIDYLKQPPMSPGGTRLVDKIRMSKQKMSPEFGSLNQRSFSEEPRGGVLPERRSFEYYEPKQAPTLYSSRGSRSSSRARDESRGSRDPTVRHHSSNSSASPSNEPPE